MARVVRGAAIEERFLTALRSARNDGFLSFCKHFSNSRLFFYQEGIALAFFADGGGETVAGIDDGIVWQCEKFMDQRVHHFFH